MLNDHRQNSGSKNIIDYKPKKIDGIIDKKIVSSTIQINDDGENLVLKINKNFLLTESTFEINKLLMTAVSPLLLNKNKIINDSNEQVHKNVISANKPFPHIAFFIENKNHYTGGRYSLWHQAILLSRCTKVTIITNQRPLFEKDFEDYNTEKLNIIVSSNFIIDRNNNEFDIVVGVPMMSGIYAYKYAEKFSLPFYGMMFETPNWSIKFRDDGADTTEEFWSGYKKCLINADKILVPSHESKKHLLEWINYDAKKVEVIYPCINELVAEKIKPFPKDKYKRIIISSRITSFKSPLSIIKKLGKKYIYYIVGKVWKDLELELFKLSQEQGYAINFAGGCSDEYKFKLIKSCDLIIHPSLFEGFGMPPMEGIYFDKPVVVYDLPVLREIYGDSITYAKWNDADDFAKKCKYVLNGKIDYKKESPNKDGDRIRVKRNLMIKRCLRDMKKVFNIPLITAGMIVYDGDDYMNYAIDSVTNLLDELLIAEGNVKGYDNNTYGKSNNGTLNIIKKFLKDNYIYVQWIIPGIHGEQWQDKIQMQNEIAKRVNGDFYLKLDHDEIWNEKTLSKVMDKFYGDENLTVVKMSFLHFWINFKTIAKDAGGKWSTKHPRIWRWKKSFRHNKSFNHFVDTKKDYTKVCHPFFKEIEFDGESDDVIFHFGYVRKLSIIKNKIKYYQNRGIENFVIDTYSKWNKMSDPTQPTQKIRSWAELYDGKLPEVLNNHSYKNINDVRKIK